MSEIGVPADARLEECLRLFAGALGEKLNRVAIQKGRSGWDDPEWTQTEVVHALQQHIDRGDPIDVAAYALFWWYRSADPNLAAERVEVPFIACTHCEAVTPSGGFLRGPASTGGTERKCPICGKGELFHQGRLTQHFDADAVPMIKTDASPKTGGTA